ncbi:MAG TPA: hypothetical protein VFN91_08990 [Myxococcaceae bacterium]|nr:hypothetical protein [Myxococcaceae bacterium]
MVDPKILDAAGFARHLQGTQGETLMTTFFKNLFTQHPRIGFSATFPELDGMP